MEINELKARIKDGNISGWYILCGEEDYLKRYYAKELREKIIPEGDPFAPFNYVSFDGADIDFAAVYEAVKSPPMMGEYKLIEWKYASLDGLKEGQKGALESLFPLKEEYPYSVFLISVNADGFDTGTKKKPSKLKKTLSAAFDIIEFSKSGDAQLLSWLKKHFDAEKISVDMSVLNAMLFRCGRSMELLNNEVIKLSSYLKANGRCAVRAEDVELVCSATVECEAFALSNAVTEKNTEKAFAALADLKMRRVEPGAVISMLEKTYSELTSVSLLLDEGKGVSDIEEILKLHAFKAKLYINAAKKSTTKKLADTLSQISRIDASSKSGGLSGYGVIEMFVTQNI